MTYVELSTSCCLSWKETLVPSFHLIYWSYNLPLRHSLACCRCCLIASSWNLLANVSDHLQHFDFFWDVNCVHDEKYPPCPRWFVLSSTTRLPSVQCKLVRVLCYTLRSLLSSICSSLPWSITIFYVKNVVRISPPLKNSWYSGTSHHRHSFSCCF